MADQFTAKFRVDISDLKKNITDAQKQIKLANATFKSQTAGMDDWTKNADGLSAKLKQLDDVLKSQKSILSTYREQLERQQKAYEENGKRVETLKAKLKELADNGVAKTSDEYQKYSKALRECQKEQQNNEKAVDDLRLKILNQEAAVGKTEKEIRQYTKAEDELGDESKKTAKDVDELSDEMEKAGKEAKNSGDGFTVVKGVLSNLATDAIESAISGLKKLGTAFVEATTGAASYADEINTMSKVTGMSTDSIQEYKYAAELVDVSLETLTGSMRKNVKSMSNAKAGSEKFADAYKQLGVAVTDAHGNLRDGETVFWESIDALGKISNETERDALAMQLFGKSAQELNPLIMAGSDEMRKLSQEAHDMGAVMSGENLDSLNQLNDSMDKLKSGAGAAKNAFGLLLLPALQSLSDEGVSFIGNFTNELLNANGDWEKVSSVIEETLDTVITKISDKLPDLLEKGGEIVGKIGESLVKNAPKLMSSATSLIMRFGTYLIKSAPKLVSTAASMVSTLASGLTSALPELLSSINSALPDVLSSLIQLAGDLASQLDDIIVPVALAIPDLIVGISESLSDEENITALVNGCIDAVQGIVDNLPMIIEKLVDSIPIVINNLVSAADTAFPLLLDGAVGLAVDLVRELPTILRSIFAALPDILKSLFNASNGLTSPSNMALLVEGCGEVVWELVKELPSILWELIVGIPKTLFESLFSDDGFFASGPIADLISGATEVVRKLAEKTSEFIQPILDKIPNIIDDIVEAFDKIKDRFLEIGRNAGEKFVSGVKEFASDPAGYIKGQVTGEKKGIFSGTIGVVKNLLGLAEGGVVTRPTVSLIGEDGAEVIMPLEKSGWIRKLAAEISGFIGGTMVGATHAVGGGINFTQNNYSPKPLSRIDIYRQTQNTLGLISKGAF